MCGVRVSHTLFLCCKLTNSEAYSEPCQTTTKELFAKIINDLKRLTLTLSWLSSLLYRNQSIYFLCKSMDCFLYDKDIRYERVNNSCKKAHLGHFKEDTLFREVTDTVTRKIWIIYAIIKGVSFVTHMKMRCRFCFDVVNTWLSFCKISHMIIRLWTNYISLLSFSKSCSGQRKNTFIYTPFGRKIIFVFDGFNVVVNNTGMTASNFLYLPFQWRCDVK